MYKCILGSKRKSHEEQATEVKRKKTEKISDKIGKLNLLIW